MQEMIYVKFYIDDLTAMEELNYEEKGRLLEAMLMYAQTGEKPKLVGNEKFVFPWMRARADRDKEGIVGRRSASRSEAGKKGAAARWAKEEAEEPEDPETDGKNGKSYGKNSKNGKDDICHNAMAKMAINIEDRKENIENRKIEERGENIENRKIEERGENNTPAREEFSPPTEKDVESFCREQGIRINAQRFVNFYASKGWVVGNTPMRDWKAAVLGWAAKDEEKADNKPKLIKSYDISEIESLFEDDIIRMFEDDSIRMGGGGDDLQRTG